MVPAVMHENEKAHKVSVFTLSLHLGVSIWWGLYSYAIYYPWAVFLLYSLQKINGARTSTRIHIRPRSVLDPVLGARHEHARALTLRALAQRGEARCVASAMRGRSEQRGKTEEGKL